MKHLILNPLLLIFFLFGFNENVFAQNISGSTGRVTVQIDSLAPWQDSLIVIKLFQLAESNSIPQSDAAIRIAEANVKLSKSAWLSSITAGANINEFVINNSEFASFFPKYNLGIAVPFDIVARSNRERRVARENLIITTQNKKEEIQAVRARVLILYETYKKRRELVIIQKNSIEYDYSGYLAAQLAYSKGESKLEVIDKAYQTYLGEKVKLAGRELDLKIARIELEQIIGMPLEKAILEAMKLK